MGRRHEASRRRGRIDLDDPTFAEAAIEVLATNDDTILRRYLDEAPIAPGPLGEALAEQTAQLQVLPGVLRRRADRRRRRRPPARDPEAAALRRRRHGRDRRRGRCSRSSEDRAARRSPSCACSPGHCERGIASSSASTRRDGHRHRGLRSRHDATSSGDPCGRDRQGPRTLDRTHRRHLRPDRPHRRPARLRPTHAGDRDRPTARGPEAGRVRRPHRTRRAGSAHQPAPGRLPPRAVPVALRRGPEGDRRPDAGGRLRTRHRVPTDDAGLHRATEPASAQPSNCSDPAGRPATRSWPRSAWRSRRCRPARA